MADQSEIEAVAREMCRQRGISPDHSRYFPVGAARAQWTLFENDAADIISALDRLREGKKGR